MEMAAGNPMTQFGFLVLSNKETTLSSINKEPTLSRAIQMEPPSLLLQAFEVGGS